MRSRQEIEDEIREKKRMIESAGSDEFTARVQPYVDALDWVLSGEAEQVGVIRVGGHNAYYTEAVLGARATDGSLIIERVDETDGHYSLLRHNRDRYVQSYDTDGLAESFGLPDAES
jgi:hypothetical protein